MAKWPITTSPAMEPGAETVACADADPAPAVVASRVSVQGMPLLVKVQPLRSVSKPGLTIRSGPGPSQISCEYGPSAWPSQPVSTRLVEERPVARSTAYSSYQYM